MAISIGLFIINFNSRRYWKFLFQCITVNIRFLLTIFKEAAGNGFLQLADICYI